MSRTLSKKPLVSVIVATRNRTECLTSTLSSLDSQSYRPFEAIVIEDGSLRDAGREVKNLSLSYPVTYRYIEKRGRAGARNEGILRARGEILLFFDDHSQPCSTLLEEHVRHHLASGKHGGFRGRVEYLEGFTREAAWQRESLCSRLIHLLYANNPVVRFGTHNLSVKRAVIEQVGSFDEEFTQYGAEDQELGIRIRKGGYRLGYLTDALAFNIRLPKNPETVLARAVESGRMASILVKKHPGYRRALGLHGLNRMIFLNRSALRFVREYTEGRIPAGAAAAGKPQRMALYLYTAFEALGRRSFS